MKETKIFKKISIGGFLVFSILYVMVTCVLAIIISLLFYLQMQDFEPSTTQYSTAIKKKSLRENRIVIPSQECLILSFGET